MGDESLDLGTFNCFQEGAVSVSYSPVAHVYFFDNMSTCHKCRLDWMGGGGERGKWTYPQETRRLLWPASYNGLHSRSVHERFLHENSKG